MRRLMSAFVAAGVILLSASAALLLSVSAAGAQTPNPKHAQVAQPQLPDKTLENLREAVANKAHESLTLPLYKFLNSLRTNMTWKEFDSIVHCAPSKSSPIKIGLRISRVCFGEATSELGIFPAVHTANITAQFADNKIQYVVIKASGPNVIQAYDFQYIRLVQHYGFPGPSLGPTLNTDGDLVKANFWLLKDGSMIKLSEALKGEIILWWIPAKSSSSN